MGDYSHIYTISDDWDTRSAGGNYHNEMLETDADFM